jgi:hypothetical protein
MQTTSLPSRSRWWPLPVLFVAALGLGVCFLSPRPGRLVGKYVAAPVPASVRVVHFQSDDWLRVHPEPPLE